MSCMTSQIALLESQKKSQRVGVKSSQWAFAAIIKYKDTSGDVKSAILS